MEQISVSVGGYSVAMRLEPAEMAVAVDLYQGINGPGAGMVGVAATLNPSTKVFMPPLNRFKKFDVRPMLQKGGEPLPEIVKRVEGLKADEGLIIVAPFLPSPLIEKLGSEGFESKLEPGRGGQWIVYFWRAD
jgi:hypothetical protein